MHRRTIILASALVALTGLAACGDVSTEQESDQAATTAAPYPPGVNVTVQTSSSNTDNPPPRDIASVTCVPDQTVGPKASGTLVNHSSELSSYMIAVNWLAGGQVVASQSGAANNIPPGATSNWEVPSFAFNVTADACEVVSVDRISATA